MARGIFSKIHYIFDQGDLDDNWDTGGLRPLRGRTRDSGFASEGVFAALKGMVTSCDPAGVRNASSGYRTACAVPLLWWKLPDGLRCESQTGTERLDGDYPRPSLENPRPRGVLCPHGHRHRLCPHGPWPDRAREKSFRAACRRREKKKKGKRDKGKRVTSSSAVCQGNLPSPATSLATACPAPAPQRRVKKTDLRRENRRR